MNFFNKNKCTNCIYNKNELSLNSNSSYTGRRNFKISIPNKKVYIKEEMQTKLLKQGSKKPKLNNSLIN
jgi:hypothetical protein